MIRKLSSILLIALLSSQVYGTPPYRYVRSSGDSVAEQDGSDVLMNKPGVIHVKPTGLLEFQVCGSGDFDSKVSLCYEAGKYNQGARGSCSANQCEFFAVLEDNDILIMNILRQPLSHQRCYNVKMSYPETSVTPYSYPFPSCNPKIDGEGYVRIEIKEVGFSTIVKNAYLKAQEVTSPKDDGKSQNPITKLGNLELTNNELTAFVIHPGDSNRLAGLVSTQKPCQKCLCEQHETLTWHSVFLGFALTAIVLMLTMIGYGISECCHEVKRRKIKAIRIAAEAVQAGPPAVQPVNNPI